MPLTTPVSSTYTVPRGYMAILRGFRYAFDPQMPAIPRDDMRVSLFVGNIGVQDYLALRLPQVVTDYIPCYVIADENQVITITINFVTNIVFPPGGSIACYNELYGNLLLKTGVPSILEPGNEAITVRSKI